MSEFRRNAIIMAAGSSSRFVPLSSEIPKGLLEVKGEILIERQIRQLQEAGVEDITIVVGYKAEKFQYLKEKFGVDLVLNEDFYHYNNISSIIRVLDRLGNTFICSSDNYFRENVFTEISGQSYYSALFANGITGEYCMETDAEGNICNVTVGGHDAWYMIGHVYLSEDFSNHFRPLLVKEYEKEEVRYGYWEDVYIKNISILPPIRIRKYSPHEIEEFDSIDELRLFDPTYLSNSRSSVLKEISRHLNCDEADLHDFHNLPHEGKYLNFSFCKKDERYLFNGDDNSIKRI